MPDVPPIPPELGDEPMDYWPIRRALADGPKPQAVVVGWISFFLGIPNTDNRLWLIAPNVIECAIQDGVVVKYPGCLEDGTSVDLLKLVEGA